MFFLFLASPIDYGEGHIDGMAIVAPVETATFRRMKTNGKETHRRSPNGAHSGVPSHGLLCFVGWKLKNLGLA